jgi:hypothetical protein
MSILGVVTTATYRGTCLRCGDAIEKDFSCITVPRKGIMHIDVHCELEKIQKAKNNHPSRGRHD